MTGLLRHFVVATSFAAALSLAALGVANLWRDVDWAGLITQQHWGRVRIDDGNLVLVHAKALSTPRWRPTMYKMPLRGRLGVLGVSSGTQGRWRWTSVTVPLWIVVALLFTHPGVALVSGPLRRRRRRRRNQCIGCGYDLRGNTSGRCPECGRTIARMRWHAPSPSATPDDADSPAEAGPFSLERNGAERSAGPGQ